MGGKDQVPDQSANKQMVEGDDPSHWPSGGREQGDMTECLKWGHLREVSREGL